MTARVHVVLDLDHDAETVFGALSGPGWAQARADAFDDDSRTVRHDAQPDGSVELVVSRELPDGGPGFLTRFLPKDGRAEQTDSWGPATGDGRTGTWRAEIPGTPARVSGTMGLQPTATGCRYVVDGDVKVPLPLVGGKAESFLADMIGRLLAREVDVLRDLLGR